VAINKAKTSTGTKVVLIVLIVAFVASFISLGAGLFTSGGNTSTTTSNDPLAQVNAQYQPTVAAITSQLQSQPESYTALVALGNTYFDWASSVQQASQTSTSAVGADQPLWVASKDAYARALKVKAGEPGVNVDYAVTLFYTGDTKTAVLTAEKVAKDEPTFAPAFFNLGIFYQALGEKEKALAALNQVIKLDPDGKQTNVEYAKQQVAALKSAGSTTTSSAP
jgi:Flp pilus assembly protein TadD